MSRILLLVTLGEAGVNVLRLNLALDAIWHRTWHAGAERSLRGLAQRRQTQQYHTL